VRNFFAAILVALVAEQALAQDIRAESIDAIVPEPIRCVRVDAMGRVFVGGRESLFAYEPSENGYHARKLLYRFPPKSDINDIEIRGNDLYVLTRSALYVLADGGRRRDRLQPKKLLWGVPRGDERQGFRALAWGPQGELYLAVGCERMQYWTFFSEADGSKTSHRGIGAVYRCKPDGTGLVLVAGGFRDIDGLAFDRHWNLVVAERTNDTARLWHVVPHGRHESMPESAALWPILERKELRIAALAYFDDDALPPKYRGYLLAAIGDDIVQLAIEAKGASLQATMFGFAKGTKPNAFAVGRGGRIFAIMNHAELVMITSKDDVAKLPFEPYEPSEATPEKLWRELGDSSWQRRYRAHIELTRRGGDLLPQANKKLLPIKGDDPALHHLIWLAALSRKGSIHLLSLADNVKPKVREQTIRAVGAFAEQVRDPTLLTNSFVDENLAVQHAALSAYFGSALEWNSAIQTVMERGAAVNDDRLLRQTAAHVFARRLTRKQLEAMCNRLNAELRLTGVIAVGIRMTTPDAKRLGDHLPLRKFGDESAYVIEYDDGKVDLREQGRVGLFTLAEHWKADKHTEDQNLLFKLLRKMQDDSDARVREAARMFVTMLEGR